MSTNGSLPAGQFTTQINGRQCTAIPRSNASQSSTAAPLIAPAAQSQLATAEAASTVVSTSVAQETAQETTSTTPPPVQVQPPSTFSTSTTPAAVPIASTSSTPVPVTTPTPSSTPAPALAPTTSLGTSMAVAKTSPSELPSVSSTSTSTTPASKATTPTVSIRTSVPIAQSEIRTSSTPTPSAITADNSDIPAAVAPETSTSASPVNTAPAEVQSSAAAGISSNPKLEAGPVVGGVLGSLALIGLVGVIFWFIRRRRRRRNSLLTPLTGVGGGVEKTFYEIDNGSVGPTKRSERWRAKVGYQTDKISNVATRVTAGIVGFGSTLKSKVVGVRSDTPSVNLNRGNSQFLDGPIPQHSRNNSLLSNTATLTARDRFKDWWDRFTDNRIFNWRFGRKIKEPADPFAAARSITEKQAIVNGQPDFSQLLGVDDREMQLQAARRRASLTNSIPNLGSLGLDFESHDPFADPSPPKGQNKAWVPPKPNASNKSNPFADPIPQPQRSTPKSQTYLADIRRSRGQSIDATNNTSAYAATNAAYRPPSTAVASRYPSSIAPSRDSYRDTVFSSFSANVRKGKGRSDPFDLERPELWRPATPPVPDTRPRGASTTDRESVDLYPSPLRGVPLAQADSPGAHPRVVSGGVARAVSNGSYASKYSSGVSSLGDWGDPGPDLGPGSSNSSLRGNASSNGGGTFYGPGGVQGSLAEIQSQRARDNGSPVSIESKASSKGGVGKAM